MCFTQALQDSIVRREVFPHSTGSEFFQSEGDVEDDLPTVVLTSGTVVKILNRKQETYLAACSECTAVMLNKDASIRKGLDNTCSGLIGKDVGCGYTVGADKFSEFEIIKVGFQNGQPISHNDLVVLRSVPNKKGDADFHAYLGICGASNEATCAASETLVRLYAGNASNAKTLPEPVMFTIAKEVGEGKVMVGEYVSFIKATGDRPSIGDGSYLASCGTGGTTGKCGAKTNLYTAKVGALTPKDKVWQAMWMVLAPHAKPPPKPTVGPITTKAPSKQGEKGTVVASTKAPEAPTKAPGASTKAPDVSTKAPEASTKASTKATAASTTAKAAPTNAPTTTAAPTEKPDATTVPPTKDEDEDEDEGKLG